jgi:hypothetical protein
MAVKVTCMMKTRTTRTPYRIGVATLAVLALSGWTLSAQRPEDRPWLRSRLSGTYDLDSTRGDNPQRAVETVTRSLPPGERDRAYQSLLARLVPPHTISIDRNGLAVSIASSSGPRAEFDADGLARSERGPNGRMVSTRAELGPDGTLTVSTNGGGRGSDFSVTFESLDNGDGLRVTRHFDDDSLPRPVMVQSYYQRAYDAPRWDVYAAGPRYGATDGLLAVPDGTRLLATLDTPLSMRTSRSGEAFTMTVRTPGEFQGARIDGLVSRVNAYRDSGNSQDMRVDFQTIELRGRSFDFGAILTTVRLADGTVLRLNTMDDSRTVNTDTTIRSGGIGAAMGAIIGAVVGGGKGAVVGAVVGGAGGVILSQGQEQLDLPRGTEVGLTVVAGRGGLIAAR